jgi:hypothetical protein
MNSNYNSPNMRRGTVAGELQMEQPPLGTKFNSYELNQAVNYYTLDPFQYNITRFVYDVPGKNVSDQTSYKNDSGLVYKNVEFEKLLPTFTQEKKSVNDFPAQSYHRFEANDGYFNPGESVNNTDLWFYGASRLANQTGLGIAGAALNVQEIDHIIFPEAQRGGVDTKNLVKYSSTNYEPKDNYTWESENKINRADNCREFDYNTGYTINRDEQPFRRVYNYDSRYCRSIGISGPYEGSMPFNPDKIS